MKTVKEVSNLAGVSVRTLHYYDTIGLLKPTEVTGAGYRLYDDTELERLAFPRAGISIGGDKEYHGQLGLRQAEGS